MGSDRLLAQTADQQGGGDEQAGFGSDADRHRDPYSQQANQGRPARRVAVSRWLQAPIGRVPPQIKPQPEQFQP
ncbi:hypothetical protein RF55_21073 [Lasius niger]|uniref:Uncharacterized protein n=1 Tax=Lasius niger TaxID=67767 RepID=A0A0J7JXZ2_LASNI|nr:hypothetical protein RF55_21073 [Lasius niger]